MWKKLEQIKKMWSLARKDPEYLKAIEGLTDEDIKNIPDRGDGGAVFMPYMTESQRDEYLKNQQPKWRKFNEKLRSIIK